MRFLFLQCSSLFWLQSGPLCWADLQPLWFSALVDSLAKRIELQGAKEKSWGCQKLIVVFILLFFFCSLRSRLWPRVCTLRRRRQSGHATETAGAAHPSPQQPTQQLANAWRAAQDVVTPRVLQWGVRKHGQEVFDFKLILKHARFSN